MSAPTFDLNPVTGRVTQARFIPSANCDSRPPGAVIEVLVIHAISLPRCRYGGDAIEHLFTNRLDTTRHPSFAELAGVRVSAHFLIRRGGALLQFVPTARRAWHAGVSRFGRRERVNDFSVGVELEGCDEHPFTAPQYHALITLARCLMTHHPRITAANIIGHSDIAPQRKTDPGRVFDWRRLRCGIEAARDRG